MTFHVLNDFGDGHRMKIGTGVQKIVQIPDTDAFRLAELTLHELDMQRCIKYLEQLDKLYLADQKRLADEGKEPSDGSKDPFDENRLLQDALWESAIATFYKCFQRSASRFKLKADEIYGNNVAALTAFKFFENLRNKHIMHDENAYVQCRTYAVLRPAGELPPVAGIECRYGRSYSYDPISRQTMKQLAEAVKSWCESEWKTLEKTLVDRLNDLPYTTLTKFEDEDAFKTGQPADVGVARSR